MVLLLYYVFAFNISPVHWKPRRDTNCETSASFPLMLGCSDPVLQFWMLSFPVKESLECVQTAQMKPLRTAKRGWKGRQGTAGMCNNVATLSSKWTWSCQYRITACPEGHMIVFDVSSVLRDLYEKRKEAVNVRKGRYAPDKLVQWQ